MSWGLLECILLRPMPGDGMHSLAPLAPHAWGCGISASDAQRQVFQFVIIFESFQGRSARFQIKRAIVINTHSHGGTNLVTVRGRIVRTPLPLKLR